MKVLGLFFALMFCCVILKANAGIASLLNNKDLSEAFVYTGANQRKTAPFGWACFTHGETEVQIKCDDLGFNRLEGPKEELQITLRTKSEIHEYGLRHGITRIECRRIKKSIELMLQSKNDFCVRGSLTKTWMSGSTTRADWVFDEIKNSNLSICEFNGCED